MNSSNIQVKNKHQTMNLDPVMPMLNLFTTNGFETTTSTFVVTIYNDLSTELTGPVPKFLQAD